MFIRFARFNRSLIKIDKQYNDQSTGRKADVERKEFPFFTHCDFKVQY